jgi:hypothetical protein
MTDFAKLFNAVQHGQVPPLKLLLEESEIDMYLTDSLGKNILHHATILGKEDIIKWLVEKKGYDVNIKDKIGLKMMNYAAMRKTKKTKTRLLKLNTEIKQLNKERKGSEENEYKRISKKLEHLNEALKEKYVKDEDGELVDIFPIVTTRLVYKHHNSQI